MKPLYWYLLIGGVILIIAVVLAFTLSSKRKWYAKQGQCVYGISHGAAGYPTQLDCEQEELGLFKCAIDENKCARDRSCTRPSATCFKSAAECACTTPIPPPPQEKTWSFDQTLNPPQCVEKSCSLSAGGNCYSDKNKCQEENLGLFTCSSSHVCERAASCTAPSDKCFQQYKDCETLCSAEKKKYYSIDMVSGKCVLNQDCADSEEARSYCSSDLTCSLNPLIPYSKTFSIPSAGARVWKGEIKRGAAANKRSKLPFDDSTWNVVKSDHLKNLAIDMDPVGRDSQQSVFVIQYGKGCNCDPNASAGICNDDCKYGAQFWASPREISAGLDECLFSYQVYFPSGMDPVLGGKLPGLYGGYPGLDLNTPCAKCTGKVPSDGRHCFTIRPMWRGGFGGELLVVVPLMRPADPTQRSSCDVNPPVQLGSKNSPFNDGLLLNYGNQQAHCASPIGCDLGRGAFQWVQGSWNRVEIYVKLNTVGGSDSTLYTHDGVIQMRVNGVTVYQATNVLYRYKSDLTVKGILFSTFYGGAEPSKYAPRSETNLYFKDFVIVY